jgi:uncharacterized membrane protein
VVWSGDYGAQVTDLSDSGYLAGVVQRWDKERDQVVVGTPQAPVRVSVDGKVASPTARVNEAGTVVVSYRSSFALVTRTVRISHAGAVSPVDAGGSLWAAGIDDDGTVVGVARDGSCIDPANPSPCQDSLVGVAPDGTRRVLADVPDSYPAEPMVVARSKPYTAGTVGGSDGRLSSYLWHDNGTVTPLQVPPGAVYTAPFAVNGHGAVAGVGVYDGAARRLVPLRWSSDGTVTVLGVPAGTDHAFILDIDEDGTAVGFATNDAQTVAVPAAWLGSQPTSLADRLSCGTNAVVYAINASGRLAGALADDVADQSYPAVAWEPARPGTLAGTAERFAGPARCDLARSGNPAGIGLVKRLTALLPV